MHATASLNIVHTNASILIIADHEEQLTVDIDLFA